jgi:multimeric flavodoxin WrbA
MKITAVLGSPRKNGTTARIAQGFMEAATRAGAETKAHYLNGMKYRGCQGCNLCKTKTEQCVQKDDLTELFNDLTESDTAVFAVPVYWWDVPGQFKSFFDRMWSLITPDYMTNPKPSRIPSRQEGRADHDSRRPGRQA